MEGFVFVKMKELENTNQLVKVQWQTKYMAGIIPNIERTLKIHQVTTSSNHKCCTLITQYQLFPFTNEKIQIKRLHKKTGSTFQLHSIKTV